MVNKKKIETSPQEVVYEAQENSTFGRFNVGNVFWGLLFIIVGGLMLADNFGYIDVHWANLWRLWPLLIIAAGLSILSLQGLFWRITTLFVSFLMLGAVVWVMLGDLPSIGQYKTTDFTVQSASNEIMQAEVKIKAGASSINIGSASQDAIVKSKFKSSLLDISKSSTVSGTTQMISLETTSRQSVNWWTGDMENIWDLDLTRQIPLAINIDAGASSVEVDLSEAKLRSAIVKIGAGSLVFKVGSLEDTVNLNIESGVSSVTLRLPNGSGVQLRLDSGLATNDVADLSKVGDNLYESSGYSQSNKKINITSKTGVSSFRIERY